MGEEGGKIRRWGFTVFVDNLPQNLDRFGLKGIFNRGGNVSDSYIPPKLGRLRNRFGFVRFQNEIDVVNSILRLNGAIIRGSRIKVSRARFERGGVRCGVEPRKVWCDIHSKKDQGKNDQGKDEMLATVTGDTNEMFLNWLNKSVICVSKEEWDVEDLSKALVEVGCAKIRILSKYKFIITFHTCEQRNDVLQNHDKVSNWFYEVKSWDIYEVCETRRFWIEIFGVPPHGWTVRNFETIASIWGKVICLETPIEDTLSFESMKILIESKCLQEVEGHIILQIGDAGYRIFIKEASCSFSINPQFVVSGGSSSMVVKGTNDQDAPERQADDVAAKGDVASNQWLNENRVDDIITAGEVQKSPKCNLNGVNGQSAEKIGKCVSISSASSSKTKTAELSGNGLSEEIAKIKCCAPSQSEEVNGHTLHSVTQPKKGRRITKISNGLSHGSQSSELSAPPGFSLQFNEGGGETLAPPGFEGFNDSELKLSNKGKTPNRPTLHTERRLTRSQAKMGKKFSLVDEGAGGVNSLGSDSEGTTDSMLQLAKESLEIGEVLGLKVIGNKKIALKRITESLKTQKSRRKGN